MNNKQTSQTQRALLIAGTANVIWGFSFMATRVVIISVNQTGEGVISLSGILYLLVAIVSASFFTVLSRSISDVFSPFERTFIMMVMGFIAFTGSAIISEGRDFLPSMVSAMQVERSRHLV